MKSSIISIIKNIELPLYHINKKFKMKSFGIFPFLSYSDGTPCNIANAYLQSSEIIKLSELTIIKIGYALSSLISFSEKHRIEFKDFNNSTMFLFSKYLHEEINPKNFNKKARSNNTTNFILKTSLYFFDFVGKKFLNNPNFCKANLNAELKNYRVSIQEKGSIEKSGWYHNSFVKKDNIKRRTPISMNDIEKLYSVIPKLSDSKYVQHRTKIMLKLLEITGARSGEIAKLKTKDIEEAFSQEKPMLKMITLKRRSGEEIRYVPVEQLDLKEIITFIKVYRQKAIRETIGKNNDNGFLFINERNGSPLLAATISNEIIKLRDLAGISVQTCAHMFRHRYITNLFVKLIKQYDLENQDDFRNALLDINSLKIHIQQATGHKDLRSLEHYIDLAKAELTNIDKVLEKVNETQKYEAIEREKKRLLEELKLGKISIDEYVKSIENL
jgi:site-specific recombinase XerD